MAKDAVHTNERRDPEKKNDKQQRTGEKPSRIMASDVSKSHLFNRPSLLLARAKQKRSGNTA